jgi:hypothetical protein
VKPSKLFHTVVIVGACLTGGCGDDRGTVDAGTPPEDAGAMIADAAMDAAASVPDAGEADDAGATDDAGQDAMVLIL